MPAYVQHQQTLERYATASSLLTTLDVPCQPVACVHCVSFHCSPAAKYTAAWSYMFDFMCLLVLVIESCRLHAVHMHAGHLSLNFHTQLHAFLLRAHMANMPCVVTGRLNCQKLPDLQTHLLVTIWVAMRTASVLHSFYSMHAEPAKASNWSLPLATHR